MIVDFNEDIVKSLVDFKINELKKTKGDPLCLTKEERQEESENILRLICSIKVCNFEEVINYEPQAIDAIAYRIQAESYKIEPCVLIKDDSTYNPIWYENHEGKSRRFNAYTKYLSTHLPASVIQKIDNDTNRIMSVIHDPNVSGPFNTYGEVVSDVQSGKTTIYLGLANKALDAGYRIVIIFAGTSSTLRNQTQDRGEEGCYGRNTDGEIIAIGKYLPKDSLDELLMFTRSDEMENGKIIEDGEIARTGLKSLKIHDKKAILVCKRNHIIIDRIIKWVKSQVQYDETNNKFIGVPVLIIADESDEAAINTGDNGQISKNNRKIRELVKSIEQVTHVGFTATPFANIYIDPEINDDDLGQDLFPRDFISYIEPTNSYVGVSEFFGDKDAYPYTVSIGEVGEFNFKRKKKNNMGSQEIEDDVALDEDAVEDIPESFKKSINNFLLVGAIRNLRGYGNKHNSMLINVDIKTAPQGYLKKCVISYLNEIRRCIEEGEDETFNDEILALWDEVKKVTEKVKKLDKLRNIDNEYRLDFSVEEILLKVKEYLNNKEEVNGAVEFKLKIREVNSTSNAERLDYSNHKDGLHVIAIGGQTLSRGFTLEGLSVTYLQRESVQMDTIIQSCRFFSHYSPNYRDLIRLYTSDGILECLKIATIGSKNLIAQIKQMDQQKKSPIYFGLHMKTVKAKLVKKNIIPTGRNKMREAVFTKINGPKEGIFAGTMFENATFYKDGDNINKSNLRILNRLIGYLEGYKVNKGKYSEKDSLSWEITDSKPVAEFLGEFIMPRDSRFAKIADSKTVAKSLVKAFNNGSIKRIDIVLINNCNEGKIYEEFEYLEHKIWAVNRKVSKVKKVSDFYETAHGKSTQSRDLKYSLTKDEIKDVELNSTRTFTESAPPEEKYVREVRDNKKSALLLIYIQSANEISKSGIENAVLDNNVKINPVSFSLYFPGKRQEESAVVNHQYLKEMRKAFESINSEDDV